MSFGQRLAFVLLVASLVVVAFVAPRLGRPTLRIAIHQGVEGVALKTLARAFSETNDASVEVSELSYGALYDAEMRALRGEGRSFDVIMVDDPWLPALIGEDGPGDSSRLQTITLDEDECESFDLGDFVPSTLQVSLHPMDPKASGSKEGPVAFTCDRPDTFYALPFVGNSQLFVMRDDLATSPNSSPGAGPPTWGDVMTWSRNDAGAGYVTRVGAGNSIVTDFLPILWTLTRKPRDPEQTTLHQVAGDPLHIEDEPGRQAFDFVRRLGENPRANRGVVSVDDFDLTINLVKEKASMSIAWSAWVMAMTRLPAPYGDRLIRPGGSGRAHLQVLQVPGGEPVLGAWLLSIPARAEESALAREFVLHVTSQGQIREAAREGNPPPRLSALTKAPDEKPEDGDSLEDRLPFFEQQRTSLEAARARPRTPHWREIEAVLGECLTGLYEGALREPETAWDRAQDGLNPIRDKQRRISMKSGDKDDVRRILDEPLPPFSCQPAD